MRHGKNGRYSILITGGLGFLGSRLSTYLNNQEYDVTLGTSKERPDFPDSLGNFKKVFIDFFNSNKLIETLREYDCIIHLASMDYSSSEQDPEKSLSIRGIGTLNLINAAIDSGIKYFLNFSTTHVYGSNMSGNISEKKIPIPISQYAISHRLSEDLFIKKYLNGEINGAIFRLSNVVGLPKVRNNNCWKLFILDACEQAIKERKIFIKSSPNTQRDFIDIYTVLDAVNFFIKNNISSNNPVFNLASGKSLSLRTVSNLISQRCEALFNFSPEVIFSTTENHKNKKFKFDVDKINQFIRTSDEKKLLESIDEILIFFKSKFVN